jgi:radical SAM superfamily enzyme YgiQ (UPF0313 family)
MKALLVYPEHLPQTYWSFREALPYIERRAALPPLGLVTVAAMLPEHWELRLIDMNVAPLRDSDLLWADVVLTSTMVVQAPSLDEVVARCNRLGVPVAAGGPYPSISPERLNGVDHVFIGEAEGAIATFAEDLERGRAKPVYRAEGFPDVDDSPVPRFDLLDLEAYASMAVQHSRGCPFSCEFCDIWKLYGRRHRVKSPDRMTAELDALLAAGWRGAVFFVDDNFIGNRRLAKRSLAMLERWQRDHGFPFRFFTEASVNLGADDELMRPMRDAGFSFVFLGIETPSIESLLGANKPVNAKLDLLESVRNIQANGIEVSSGFIVGFDEDTDDIFDRQIAFIREAGIPIAMVGILTALQGTDLYERLRREGRLLGESFGNNTHAFEANFVTRMPADRLAEGYKRVLRTLYDPTARTRVSRGPSSPAKSVPYAARSGRSCPSDTAGSISASCCGVLGATRRNSRRRCVSRSRVSTSRRSRARHWPAAPSVTTRFGLPTGSANSSHDSPARRGSRGSRRASARWSSSAPASCAGFVGRSASLHPRPARPPRRRTAMP